MFDFLKSLVGNDKPNRNPNELGYMDYGRVKNNGGHDHRYNKGNDRTPAQISGDKKRRKDQD